MTDEPTSKKGRVRAAFKKDGATAAKTLAATLKVGPSRVKRWLKAWSDGGGDPSALEPSTPRPVAAPKPRNPKDRLHLKGRPELTGTFLERGAKESKVLWDNGNIVTAKNSWVVPIRVETRAS